MNDDTNRNLCLPEVETECKRVVLIVVILQYKVVRKDLLEYAVVEQVETEERKGMVSLWTGQILIVLSVQGAEA